ncbi:MAG: cobalamin-dependent protein, partial [Spirochaetota bacterium]
IGKNIVAMMLENHGFNVIDLGKDVDATIIIDAVKEHAPDILCLSSLLTTTMYEMKTISQILKDEKLEVSLLVGGAVVTREFAESIGASYAEDAVEGARIAKKLSL